MTEMSRDLACMPALPALVRGSYAARFACCEADLHAAQNLRQRAFRGVGHAGSALDQDGFDQHCGHMLIEDHVTGALLCTFRIMQFDRGRDVSDGYAAQFYDLSGLAEFEGPLLEIGRFCLEPGASDPDILRLAWGALTAHVDAYGVKMLFGCSSFAGISAEAHLDAFALLRARHLAPARWRPGVKSQSIFPFAAQLQRRRPDLRAAMQAMPPLLRSYLAMGGWVSDHAVVDRDLGTLHVFTGVEIAAIPPSRAKALRLLAG